MLTHIHSVRLAACMCEWMSVHDHACICIGISCSAFIYRRFHFDLFIRTYGMNRYSLSAFYYGISVSVCCVWLKRNYKVWYSIETETKQNDIAQKHIYTHKSILTHLKTHTHSTDLWGCSVLKKCDETEKEIIQALVVYHLIQFGLSVVLKAKIYAKTDWKIEKHMHNSANVPHACLLLLQMCINVYIYIFELDMVLYVSLFISAIRLF